MVAGLKGVAGRAAMAAAAACCLAAAPVLSADSISRASQTQGVMLFDTGTAADAPLPGGALRERSGWRAVRPDAAGHEFAGDLVMCSAATALVLRRQGSGAEFYRWQAGRPAYRALLTASLGGKPPQRLGAFRAAGGSPARAVVEAEIQCESGGIAVLRFALGAAGAALGVSSGSDGVVLRICDDARYLVVPDELAADMVYWPRRAGRVSLPTERMLAALHEGCQSILVSVWSSSRQDAEMVVAGEDRGLRIAAYEVALPRDAAVWIASLEAPGIWHARFVRGGMGGEDLALDWSPPFPARWRVHVADDEGTGRSAFFRYAQEGLADGRWTCRFDGGRALVRLREGDEAGGRLLMVYPLARAAGTPPDAACVADVMREALGAGACEWLLEAEGLADGSDRPPDAAMLIVERELRKPPARRDTKLAAEMLDGAVRQFARGDQRIDAYRVAAREILRNAPAEAVRAKLMNEALRAAGLEPAAAVAGADAAPDPGALVDRIRRVVKEQGPLENCAGAIDELTIAAAAQRSTLARWRMAFRYARARCREGQQADMADLRGVLENTLWPQR